MQLKTLTRYPLIILLLGSIAACEQSYEDQIADLEELASSTIGSGTDFWIVKHSVFGFSERVGLIFGFVSDQEACEEFVQAHSVAFEGSYSCEPAN